MGHVSTQHMEGAQTKQRWGDSSTHGHVQRVHEGHSMEGVQKGIKLGMWAFRGLKFTLTWVFVFTQG